MKKPEIKNLIRDPRETRRIKEAVKKYRGIKITVNIDADSLEQLRVVSGETGVPYQRLLNKYLREGLSRRDTLETRLQKLEKELEQLKKRVAA